LAIFFGVIALAGFMFGMNRFGLSWFMTAFAFLILLIGGLTQGRIVNAQRVDRPQLYWLFMGGCFAMLLMAVAMGYLSYGRSIA